MKEKIWNKDFLLLIISNFLMYITYYAVISALPIYLVSELHATKAQVGLVVAAYTLASVMIRPFSGFTLDKFSHRMIFLLALLAYSVLFIGYLFAISIAALILLRFAQGLSWGFSTIAASAVAIDTIPVSKRGEGLGYFGMSTTLGMSVGPVVGLFISHHHGYLSMFVSGFFISLASLAAAYAIHLRKRYLVKKRTEFDWKYLFHKKSILPSLNVLIIMMAYGGLLSFIALYGREIGIQNTSLFFLIFSVGIASSRVVAGKVFDRKGPRNIITFCLILLVIGFPLLALVTNAIEFYLSALLIGFGIGVVFPTFQSMVNMLADINHRGAANSTLYTAVDIGMGSGMIIAGLIAQYISISAIFWMNTMICFVGLLFFRLFVIGSYEDQK
ncbi:MAG: MFS transporter [Bacteroidales bacterium]